MINTMKPYGQMNEEEDPYGMASDSVADQPEQRPDTPADQPEAKAPEPYTPPTTTATPKERAGTAEGAPARTFAQLEAEGQARPPMPESAPAVMGMLEGEENQPANTPPVIDYAPSTTALPPGGTTENGGGLVHSPATDQMIPGGTTDENGGGLVHNTDQFVPQAPVNAAAPQSGNSILDLLTGGARGDQSDLQKATAAKARAQLDSSSPYDSKAVRDEYDLLGAGIDDQFATDNRALDESMAARGLYGSAGKDFHSGRASDLNVGKRSAKTALASDLANKYAASKGAYDANAINQAQGVGQTYQSNKLGYLDRLMGYGDTAFNHDLATSEFQQRQNESEQDFLMRMLAAGYGV